LVGEFVSEGVSGTRIDRPDIEQLRAASTVPVALGEKFLYELSVGGPGRVT
jgi:hypothetical protein